MFYINKNVSINDSIREKEIRLAGEEESMIISTKDALNLAEERGLDLVMISPTAKPPVCKIMDYSRLLYEQSKKQKEAKKNQKIVQLKEVRLSATIEENDIVIKANNAKKFLSNGNKVKVSIRFKGRQNNHTNMGLKIFDRFISKLDNLGVVEKSAQLEGRNMYMILSSSK